MSGSEVSTLYDLASGVVPLAAHTVELGWQCSWVSGIIGTLWLLSLSIGEPVPLLVQNAECLFAGINADTDPVAGGLLAVPMATSGGPHIVNSLR